MPKLHVAQPLALWLVKEVTFTVEVVTSPIKQSKNGQSKITTLDRAIITACEAVKVCPTKMTAQQSSQLVNFLEFAPLRFLSSITLIFQHRNGARGRAALP